MCELQNLKSLYSAGLLLLLPGLAGALPEDRDKPIQLEADHGQWDQRAGISVYEGNVVIIQGSLRVNAATATVYLKDDQFQHIDTTGKPVVIRYKPAADKEEIHATSLNARYDAVKDIIILTNEAKVVQGGDSFAGDYIEYELQTDLVRARSDKGGRIQITIPPRSERPGGLGGPAAPRSERASGGPAGQSRPETPGGAGGPANRERNR